MVLSGNWACCLKIFFGQKFLLFKWIWLLFWTKRVFILSSAPWSWYSRLREHELPQEQLSKGIYFFLLKMETRQMDWSSDLINCLSCCYTLHNWEPLSPNVKFLIYIWFANIWLYLWTFSWGLYVLFLALIWTFFKREKHQSSPTWMPPMGMTQ